MENHILRNRIGREFWIGTLFEERSLKQISRGQPRNKGHSNQTILIGGFEN